jgi:archaeosortase B (VPXXXP-CTERM-specific)
VPKKKGNKQKAAESPRPGKKRLNIKKRLKEAWGNPAYRFVLLFIIYLGIVAIVYPLITNHFYFIVEGMMVGTAQIEGFILGIFSSGAHASGKLVTYGHFPVKIIEECTGIYEILIFIAAVMAFPTSLKKKGIGLAFGIPLMYLFNIVRILVLLVVGSYYYEIFDFMHLYFWQVTLILMITSVWVLWILKVVRHEEKVLATDS